MLSKREPITIGESGASVERLTDANGAVTFLKTVRAAANEISWAGNLRGELSAEAKLLEWLDGRLPVPKALAFEEDVESASLLMSPIPGENIADLAERATPAQTECLIQLLAEGLQVIHSVDCLGCPQDVTIDSMVQHAIWITKHNLVDMDDLEDRWRRDSASEILAELLARVPAVKDSAEESVLIHGDYCLPNILVQNGKVSGFVDWGSGGIGDRYFDLALARRSIVRNWDEQWVQPFFDAYGLPEPDEERLDFFELVDKFF